MASSIPGADSTPQLADYVTVPAAALGPALNEQGYLVGRVERTRLWVTDGTYRSALDPPRPRHRLTGSPMSERRNGMVPVFDTATEVAG
jgi:hypothetical protein